MSIFFARRCPVFHHNLLTRLYFLHWIAFVPLSNSADCMRMALLGPSVQRHWLTASHSAAPLKIMLCFQNCSAFQSSFFLVMTLDKGSSYWIMVLCSPGYDNSLHVFPLEAWVSTFAEHAVTRPCQCCGWRGGQQWGTPESPRFSTGLH